MIGLIQKVVLSIITILLSILFASGVFTFSSEPEFRKDKVLIVVSVLLILSVFSFIFHLKTISFYRGNSNIIKSFNKNSIVWYLNVLFGVVIIILGVYIAIEFADIYDKNIQTEFTLLTIIVVSILLIGIWVCLDYYNLWQILKKAKTEKYLSQIDDITGNESD